jgi:S-adenosylmethionine-diacylglycerol 3-amino-3-carboxypropyl transferase
MIRPDPGPGRSIEQRASFETVRYGSVWEDADVLCDALAPVSKGGRLLSIASAGDNVLALLTLDPAEIVAVDLSAAQLACLALRMEAFRHLDDEDLLGFLGVSEMSDRLRRYHFLREGLPAFARIFWDDKPDLVEAGVAHCGKFEAYFRTFRRHGLRWIHPPHRIAALLTPRSRREREVFYREEWDTWRWRLLFKVFFSRLVMGRLGRDPEFFHHVDGPVAVRIRERSRRGLVTVPTHTNPYLSYILTGRYRSEALPPYLRPDMRGKIRDRLDRIRIHHGGIEEVDGRFDGFNLSDVFEYMSPAEHERCYGSLLNQARPGARLAYWNMLVPRHLPSVFKDRVQALDDLARDLHERDRAVFYESFHVDEVMGHG